MHIPVDISLRGIPASSALERYIGAEARKLERICDRMRSCEVVAEALQQQQQRSAQFAVRLIITLPGKEVVVNREHGKDVYMAVRNAFEAAGMQLKKNTVRRVGSAGRRSGNGTPGRGTQNRGG